MLYFLTESLWSFCSLKFLHLLGFTPNGKYNSAQLRCATFDKLTALTFGPSSISHQSPRRKDVKYSGFLLHQNVWKVKINLRDVKMWKYRFVTLHFPANPQHWDSTCIVINLHIFKTDQAFGFSSLLLRVCEKILDEYQSILIISIIMLVIFLMTSYIFRGWGSWKRILRSWGGSSKTTWFVSYMIYDYIYTLYMIMMTLGARSCAHVRPCWRLGRPKCR